MADAQVVPINRGQEFLDAYTVDVGRLLEEDAPEVDFLVPGCIPRGNIVLLTGPSSSRKTWLAYELARAVAAGDSWMGSQVRANQGSVLMLNYDNPTETMIGRIRQLEFKKEMPIKVHTQGMTRPPRMGMTPMLTLPVNASGLRQMLEYYRPTLTIVDSLRQAHNLDENSSKDAAVLMQIFKTWTAIEKNTVVLIHHTAKGEGATGKWQQQARGSGEIIAAVGVVIEAAEQEGADVSDLRWTKHQAWNMDDARSMTFTVKDDPTDDLIGPLRTKVLATSSLPGESIITNSNKVLGILEKADRALTHAEICAASKINTRVVGKTLRLLLRAKRIVELRTGPTRTKAYRPF